MNIIDYHDFTYEGQNPYKGLNGKAAAYIIGIKPSIELDLLSSYYTITENSA